MSGGGRREEGVGEEGPGLDKSVPMHIRPDTPGLFVMDPASFGSALGCLK